MRLSLYVRSFTITFHGHHPSPHWVSGLWCAPCAGAWTYKALYSLCPLSTLYALPPQQPISRQPFPDTACKHISVPRTCPRKARLHCLALVVVPSIWLRFALYFGPAWPGLKPAPIALTCILVSALSRPSYAYFLLLTSTQANAAWLGLRETTRNAGMQGNEREGVAWRVRR